MRRLVLAGTLTAALAAVAPVSAMTLGARMAVWNLASVRHDGTVTADLSAALDATNLVWRTDGAAKWSPQVSVSRDGIDAAKSGRVSGADKSGLETTVAGPGILAWSWRLDTLMGGNASVDVLLDGVWLENYVPTGVWTEASLEIKDKSEHTIRFEFWNTGADADDVCAYIDMVSFQNEDEAGGSGGGSGSGSGGNSGGNSGGGTDTPPPPVATTYTVTFNANGGTGGATRTLTFGAALVVPTVSRTGYTFVGWSPAVSATMPAGNATYVAQWTPTTYKVAFNANGGKPPKGKKMVAQTMTYGTAAKLRKNVFTRSGWIFAGWAVSKANAKRGVIAYTNAQSVQNLRTDGGTTTLYAVWAKKTYKVAFYANGGKGTMPVESFTYGKAKKLSKNKFKKKGSTFVGWAKSKAAAKQGTVTYKNKAKVKNLVTNGKTVKLYAVWKKK